MIPTVARSALSLLCGVASLHAQAPARQRPPIIDMHLHAFPAAAFGPPPVPACAPPAEFAARDPNAPFSFGQFARCEAPLASPGTDEEMSRRTLAILERYNITAVASGPPALVRAWQASAPGRIIAGTLEAPLDSLRHWAATGAIKVLGELSFQYQGLRPTDSLPAAYFDLAEELDLPVGLHVGLGPPGAAYIAAPTYRMGLSNPLLLEEILVRHPKLRLYVMHAGWPMIDQMIGLLYAHPQVYVDIGVLDWWLPRPEFHGYLKRLVDAGFADRIMFGSDQMIWPEAIPIAVRAIETAPYLSAKQKRDILYNNAVRFLRLPAAPQH